MKVEFPLGQPARIFLAVLASILSLVLAYFAASNFVVNALLTPAVSLSRSEVQSGITYFPRSPGLQALFASIELAEDRDPEAAAGRAESAATRAVNLNPRRYDYRLLVALAREMKGDRPGAEQALREALALAPNRVETHWRLANVLLRQGKLDESLPFFSQAVSARHVLLAQTLALLWDVSGGKVDKMQAAVGNSPKGQRDLAFFLVQRGLLSDAVRVFNHIRREDRLASDESGTFVTALLNAGQLDLARNIWGEMVTENSEDLRHTIFNGGLERDVRPGFEQFDWNLTENGFMRATLSAGTAHSGVRALRIDFKGGDTTQIDGEIRQFVLVRPGQRYFLSAWVKTNALQTPEGPRLVVTLPDRTTQIAASAPVKAGTDDWQELSVTFTVPPGLEAVIVQIKRIPKFSYDEPTRGTVWFDDFRVDPVISASPR
ncbi:MAG: carbohydrate binding domain-containing protein [Acidobacteriota bacterium]